MSAVQRPHMPVSPACPSRKASTAKDSPKSAFFGAAPAQNVVRRSAKPQMWAEISALDRVQAALQPLDLATRRASLPGRHLVKDIHFHNELTRDHTPPPTSPVRRRSAAVIPSTSDDVPNGDPPPYAELPPAPWAQAAPIWHHIMDNIDDMALTLPLPVFQDIKTSRLVHARPDLAGRTVEDLQKTCRAYIRTWDASRRAVAIPPIEYRANEITCEIMANDLTNFVPPTHLLIITASPTSQQPVAYSLKVVHDLPYLTQCSALRLKRSVPPVVMNEQNRPTVTLPIVHLQLPAPANFDMLDACLYSENLTVFFEQLVTPFRTPKTVNVAMSNMHRVQRAVAALCIHCSFAAIARRLLAIRNLHANAMALCLVDPAFWRVINVAWFVLATALKGKRNEMRNLRMKKLKGRSSSVPAL